MYLRILPKAQFERLIQDDEEFIKLKAKLEADQEKEKTLTDKINKWIDKKRRPNEEQKRLTKCKKKVESLGRALYSAQQYQILLENEYQLAVDEHSFLSHEIRKGKSHLYKVQQKIMSLYTQISHYEEVRYKKLVRQIKKEHREKRR